VNPGAIESARPPTEAEFDSFASHYEELHASSIKITGETPEYFAAYKASYIARILPPGPCRILDYGCGIGMLSRHLLREVPHARVDGFDPSQESIARIDAILRAQGIFTSNSDLLSSNYDLIAIANVLHHVKPDDRQDLIDRVTLRLAPMGKLVIFEHNPANPLTRWAVAHCAFDGDAILLWPGETIKYLKRAGLTTARDYIVFFPRWLGSLRRFEPLLRSCPLGAQYAVIGAKST
jgi:2-polyprenyl-3-methyl-5-hydroxy-6-metoxy-1,4-benzoquinol methylase